MSASNGNTAPRGLRGWWLRPPRTGTHLLINPMEYRHLRFYGVTRIAAGAVAAGAGFICLSYHVYGWAAFFLVIGALNIGGGCWFVSIDNSRPAQT